MDLTARQDLTRYQLLNLHLHRQLFQSTVSTAVGAVSWCIVVNTGLSEIFDNAVLPSGSFGLNSLHSTLFDYKSVDGVEASRPYAGRVCLGICM